MNKILLMAYLQQIILGYDNHSHIIDEKGSLAVFI